MRQASPVRRRGMPRLDELSSRIVEAMRVPTTPRRRIEVVDYDPTWPVLFAELGPTLRAALGVVALRIDHNPERTKRYFREAPGHRRTHLHVRRAGSFSQQVPLLLRDYLRCHADAAAEFGTVKRRLARQFAGDGAGYTDAKTPCVWDILRRADEWAQLQGWEPGPSDA
jgi:GrpB-like predicted nucleotidyltransferase (UPF0157 family)